MLPLRQGLVPVPVQVLELELAQLPRLPLLPRRSLLPLAHPLRPVLRLLVPLRCVLVLVFLCGCGCVGEVVVVVVF